MKAKSLFTTLLIAFSLSACAHNPRQQADFRQDRANFVAETNEKLNDYEKKADKMTGDRAKDLRASIRDVRVDLRGIETADEYSWGTKSARVNQRLDRIRTNFNLAE